MKVSIAAMRVNRELTQLKVADMLGINASTLRSWEKGITSPTYEQLLMLCSMYNCSFEDIFVPKKSA